MNAVGMGLVVGLGAVIGFALVSSGAPLTEYVLTFGFYGFCAAVAFEIGRFVVEVRKASRR